MICPAFLTLLLPDYLSQKISHLFTLLIQINTYLKLTLKYLSLHLILYIYGGIFITYNLHNKVYFQNRI